MTEGFVLVRPLGRVNPRRNYVKEKEILQGFEITRLEEEPLELRVKVPLESFILGSENGDIVMGHRLLQCLEEKGFLYQFRELRVVGIEEGDEDRVGIDLGGGGGV